MDANLLKILIDLENLLFKVKEDYWADQMRSMRYKMQHGESADWREEFALTGSMGTFEDLIISKMNGHASQNTQQDNDELDALRSQLFKLLKLR